MKVKISKENTKMGKIASVSTTPGKACLGCEKVCLGDCYAMKAYRQYPSTRNAYDSNFQLACTDLATYMYDIQDFLAGYKRRFFRWHVAGDILSHDYFRCMIELANQFPAINFLAFTKQYNIVNEVLNDRKKTLRRLPDNLSIVFSAWPGLPIDNPHNLPVAYMQDGTETRIPDNAIECPGNCETCGLCYKLSDIGRDVVFMKH